MSPSKIQTTRQVFEELAALGIAFGYYRIPISHEQSPTESFVDELLSCLDGLDKSNAIVFSGGMGVGRTTFAMIAASIYRNTVYSTSKPRNPTLHLIYNLDKGTLHLNFRSSWRCISYYRLDHEARGFGGETGRSRPRRVSDHSRLEQSSGRRHGIEATC